MYILKSWNTHQKEENLHFVLYPRARQSSIMDSLVFMRIHSDLQIHITNAIFKFMQISSSVHKTNTPVLNLAYNDIFHLVATIWPFFFLQNIKLPFIIFSSLVNFLSSSLYFIKVSKWNFNYDQPMFGIKFVE